MPMPRVGDVAPEFNLSDQHGNAVRLSDFDGKYVVLYFYPKDDTPGCTVEACAFRDDYQPLQEAGAAVVGVSPDDTDSHQRFANKFSLPFQLLADTGHQVAESYGAWVDRGGRMGIQRSTFLIGPDRKLVHVWEKVKPDEHLQQVRDALRSAVSGTGTSPAQSGGDGAAPAVDTSRPDAGSSATRRRSTGGAAAGKTAARKRSTAKTAAKKTATRGAAKTAAKKTATRGAAKTATKKTAARKSATAGGGKKQPARKTAAKRTPGATHKSKPVAKRGRMRPGANAPAGGAGARKSTAAKRPRR
jgi:peroxiredoxin Q/BCP